MADIILFYSVAWCRIEGYGQDRKIVIDSILYQDVMVDIFGSKFHTTEIKKENEKIIKLYIMSLNKLNNL